MNTFSNIRPAKFLVAFCAGLLAVCSAAGQASNISPYSRYGLGEIYDMQFAQNSGMGGVTLPFSDSFLVNIANPASYAFLSLHNPVIDVSARGRMYRFITNADSTRNYSFSLANIVMAVPLSRKAGMAFGILPYSTSGYNISYTLTDASLGNINYVYKGSGGINKVFGGFGYRIIHRKNHDLALGLNTSFLFGELLKERKVIYLGTGSGTYHTKIQNSFYVADVAFDAGLLYKTQVGDRGVFSLGINYNAAKKIHAKQSLLAYTFSSLIYESLVDTIDYQADTKGYFEMPSAWGYAMAYQITGKREKNAGKLTIAAQYSMQNWNNYRENFGKEVKYDFLRNSSSFQLGLQLVPRTLGATATRIRTFALSTYRLGGYVRNTYLQLQQIQITERGITVGIGIPLVYSFSYSMLNIGLDLGTRGTINNNLVKENYLGVHIGYAMSPNRQADRWFIKRKFD